MRLRSPLVWIAAGLLIVAVDIRTALLDVIPDPVGWALIAVGAWRLSMVRAAQLALATAALSLADLHLPYHQVQFDPVTNTYIEPEPGRGGYREHLRFDPVTGWRLAAMTLAMAAAGAALWSLLTGLQRRARTRGEVATARRLSAFPVLVVGVWVTPYLVAVGAAVIRDSGSFDPIWNTMAAEIVAVAGLVTLVALALLLCLESPRAWAAPVDAARVSPWAELRGRRRRRRSVS